MGYTVGTGRVSNQFYCILKISVMDPDPMNILLLSFVDPHPEDKKQCFFSVKTIIFFSFSKKKTKTLYFPNKRQKLPTEAV